MLSLTKFQTLGHQSYIFFDESSVVKQREIESMAVLFSENLALKFNDTHPIQTTQ